MAQEVEDIVPPNRIKSFLDVEFEQQRRGFISMKTPRKIPNKNKVIVNAPGSNEGTLGVGNEIVHVWCEAQGKNFGNNLGNGVDKAYRTKVADALRTLLLGQQGNESRV